MGYDKECAEVQIGNKGEKDVLRCIKSFLPKPYYVLRKVRPTEKCGDIDLVIITCKGIFVIECKNWYGNIYTSRDRATATVFNTEKHLYTNPIIQVETNTYKIYRLLKHLGNAKYNTMELEDNKGYFAYAVFTNRARDIHTDLNEEENRNCGIRVRKLSNLKINMLEVYNKADNILNETEMKEICEYIKQNVAEYKN